MLTRDHDFADTISYPPKQFHDIVILCIHFLKAEKLIKEIESLLSKVKNFEGKLLIIKEEKVEIIEESP